MNGFSTGFADVTDKEALVELQTLVGGGFATSEDFEHWFLGHPYGEVKVPVVRAPDGALVAAAWIFPSRVIAAGEEVEVAQAANLHVHPAFRGTFVYALLSRHLGRTLAADYPLHFSLVSPTRFERQQSTRPESVASVEKLIRVIDHDAWARHRLRDRWRRPVGWLLRKLSRAMFRESAPVNQRSVQVQPVDQIDARFDQFWKRVRPVRTMQVRSAEFLRWRFEGLEHRSYRVLIAERSGRMVGYVVFRAVTVGGDAVGHIVDLLTVSDHEGTEVATALLAAAESHARACGCAVLSAAFPSESQEWCALVRGGFRPNPLGRFGRLQSLWSAPLLAAVLVHDRESLPASIGVGLNWHLSLVEHEMI